MREIFELQRGLNIYTLKRIGLDFEEILSSTELKPIWIENYRKALSAELAELVREVHEHGFETHNGRVEIVDMLHFLVSLSHLVEIQPTEVGMDRPPSGGEDFSACVVRCFLALDELQNSLKWKWWAKGGGFKEDRAREAVLHLWSCFQEACAFFRMGFDQLKSIYVAKNRINFQRQDQHYNEDTKTEADNQSLARPA
ncbi:MAG: dUTPase [Syntrophobacteraceae bacterium]|jgi:dimeric dUTPase (all-alpha-NTP-PPase superfamily)|nr:dUTPase [Syntrophobacteraceae bacterium]